MNPLPLLRRLLPLAALAALAVPASASAAETGLNFIDTSDPNQITSMLDDARPGWARHFVSWDVYEPARGQINTAWWGQLDPLVEAEQARGVKTLLVVTGAPQWANGHADPRYPPNDVADYASFVGRLAERYAGKVDAIEIWNEPDEVHFWKPAPDIAKYVAMLKAANAAIKAASPSTMVVFGPTTGNNYEWVEKAYGQGAKGHFDAMAVHTDTACLVVGPQHYYRMPDTGRIGQYTFLGYREVRATMLANGDDKPIIMSELGWSTSQKPCYRIADAVAGRKAGVTETQQAQFLREAYSCLAEDPYVIAALWFNSKDRGNDGGELNSYGLQRFDGSFRPAYDAFKAVRGGQLLPGPCGDFVPPKIEVLRPTPGEKFFNSLVIRAKSPDNDVLRMTFAVDGAAPIRNYTNNGNPLPFSPAPELDWQGARNLSVGQHTVKITAVDSSGNVGEATVPVERVSSASQVTAMPAQFDASRTKLTGKGQQRRLAGRIRADGNTVNGKVLVVWQAKRKKGWKKIHSGLRSASKPFSFNQKLKFKGQWRVRVQWGAGKPYTSAMSCWLTFSTSGKKVGQVCPRGAQPLLPVRRKRR